MVSRWVAGAAGATRYPTNGQGGASATNTASELTGNITVALTGATWTEATRTLTKTGAFTEYAFAVSGDRVYIASGTGATAGNYEVASRTSANAIVLTTSIGAAADAQTDIAGSLQPKGAGLAAVTVMGFWVSVAAAGLMEVVDGFGTTIPGLTITLAAGSLPGWYPLGEGVAVIGANLGVKLAAGITANMHYRKGIS